MKKPLIGFALLLSLGGCRVAVLVDDKPTTKPSEEQASRIEVVERNNLNGDSIYGPFIYIIRDKETHRQFVIVQSGHGISIAEDR
jgi:hypothetical protein